MDKLVTQLKMTQATLFSFMIKSWGLHWNVESRNFSEHHRFFSEIYNQAFSEIDVVSEHIRQCEAQAPAALSKFMEISQIVDSVVPMTADEMRAAEPMPPAAVRLRPLPRI